MRSENLILGQVLERNAFQNQPIFDWKFILTLDFTRFFQLAFIILYGHMATINMHQVSDDFYTVGKVLGLFMNFEVVTNQYMWLECKQEVLETYHATPQSKPK